MADIFTKEKRSEVMSKIKSESMLEKAFAKELSKIVYPLGYRYRLNYKNAPGRPDIAFVSRKLAVFVDGDFWHGYKFAERKAKLKQAYWLEKIQTNIRRDKRNRRKLKKNGWTYIRIWEHDVKKALGKSLKRITDALEAADRKA
ncbi:MAG TPA: very short patch repair endonuclease [Candidatus Paceibacterota bacterium]